MAARKSILSACAALLAALTTVTPSAIAEEAADAGGPDEVGAPVHPVAVDVDMHSLPPATQGTTSARVLGEDTGTGGPAGDGDALQSTFTEQASADSAAPLANETFTEADPNFDGITSGFFPPDPNIDVGPDHIIQMVNVSFQIWEKDDLTNTIGPAAINSLWTSQGVGNLCNNNNHGDPIVVYDHMADRWIMSQFAIPNGFGTDPNAWCVAVSQTPDPMDGTWFLYEFPFSNTDADPNPFVAFDYPKMSVWPDAFYLSSQRGYPGGSIDVWAYDRANMLNGQPATYQRFNIGTPALMVLPSDLDGPPPPAGTPALFARMVDGDLWSTETGDSTDRVELWEFSVDWQDPTNSAVTALSDLPTLGFDSALCSAKSLFDVCVPQPGTTQQLSTIPNWPMFRLQFRQFDGYQTLVFNHTVDADGTGHAGIRWYELRRPDGGAWGIHQQGTHSPDFDDPGLDDDLHRWMGSVAMDKAGNIALGYSTSSDTVFPSINYAGRLASDPLGLMPAPETTLVSGTASQPPTTCAGGNPCGHRWGDYSSMVVDAADDCTFWYSTQYHDTNTAPNHSTRIGAFYFESCNEADLSIFKNDRQDPVNAGDQLIYDLTVRNAGPDTAFDVEVVDTLPPGLEFVTATTDCTLSEGTGPDGEDQLTCDLGDLPPNQSTQFSIKLAVPQDFVVASGPTGIVNTATVSSKFLDPNQDNNSATEHTIIDEEADLAVAKICKPDGPLRAGETGFCDIFVDNHGPSAARDVELTDEIETDTTLTSLTASSSHGSCSVSGHTVDCDLGDLDAKDRAVVHVEFSADEPGDVNDRATVTSDTPDPDTSNNEATESVTVEGVSDLALSKTDSPDPVVAGEDLTYTLTVTNNGPSTAQNVVVSDVLSSEVEVVSVSASGGGSCEAGTPGDPFLPTACTFGSIAPSDSREVTIVVTVSPDALGTIHNDATVTNDHFDDDNGNDVATEPTTVIAQADLSLTKQDFADPAVAGEGLSYQLTLVNDGPSTAHGVVVEDALPDEVTFVSATIANASGTCVLLDTPPNTVSCELATVQPNAGDPVVITIETLVDPAVLDGTTITNTATVSATTDDPDPGNDSDGENTLIEAVADLVVDKTSDKDVYSPSDNIVYTVSVTNAGPSDAQDVVLVDALPLTDKKVIYVHDDQGCTYDPSPAHTVTCDVGLLPASATFTVDITIAIKGNLGTITNTADGSSTTTDPVPDNNAASYDVTVTGGPGKGGGQGNGSP